MKISQVISYLEEFAPPALQEDYDNSGLLVGGADANVNAALISLDVTSDVIDEAIKKGCNLIISHHPIIFSGLKKITGSSQTEKIIIKSIQNNIALYALHTNLDNVQNGVNNKICEILGLINTEILNPKPGGLKKLVTFVPEKGKNGEDIIGKVKDAIFNAGAGHIGNYDHCSYYVSGTGTFRGGENTNSYIGEKGQEHHEPELKLETIFPAYAETKIINALLEAHPYEEVAYDIYKLDNKNAQTGSGMIGDLPAGTDETDFLQMVKQKMNAGCIKHTNLLNKKVKRVAVCGGSGSFLLKNAINKKADVFITADFKYHQFFEAENKIVIADIGHYESEQFTIDLIYDLLTKRFNNFALRKSEVKTNPINYL